MRVIGKEQRQGRAFGGGGTVRGGSIFMWGRALPFKEAVQPSERMTEELDQLAIVQQLLPLRSCVVTA